MKHFLFFLTIITPLYGKLTILKDLPHFYSEYDNCSMATNGESSLLASLIHHQSIVFDVGANRGEWSEQVLRHNPSLIVMFEPISKLAQMCTEKFQNYPVKIFNIALSNTRGYQDFFYYSSGEDLTMLSGLFYRPILEQYISIPPEKIIVKTLTLDQFCIDNNLSHIDFLKIDTEGAEMNVLLGATSLIKNKAIDIIQFEYGGTYRDAQITLKAVYEFLRNHGYNVYRVISQGIIYIPQWRDSLENYRYSNFIASSIPL